MAGEGSPLLGLAMRLPPTNLPAEQALLGGLLANNKAYDQVAGWLKAEHFADPVHGVIYGAIARRIDAGRLADAVTLGRESVEWAGAGPFASDAEARGYLAQLLTAMVSPLMVKSYADAVVDCWHRRELIHIGEELVNRAMEPGGAPAREIHEAAEEALARLADGQEGDAAPVPAHQAMELAIEEAWKARDVPGGLVGLSTGLAALDDATGGLQRADYIVLGARPSMGKTTLAETICVGAARTGAKVALFSFEMRALALGGQLAAGLTPVTRDLATRGKERERDELGRFRWRPMAQHEADMMLQAKREMMPHTLMIFDRVPPTMPALRAAVRRMKRRGGVDLVAVDYLQLMGVPDMQRRGASRYEIVTVLSNELKRLAQDFDIPVLVLAQLSRAGEERDVKRPQLSDLRDSGAIEQDADVVMFLHRDHYYLKRKKMERSEREDAETYYNRLARHEERMKAVEGRADIHIDKARKGRTGTVHLAYGEDTTWFTDLPDGGE